MSTKSKKDHIYKLDNLDQKRKRNFFSLMGSIGIIMLFVFSLIDYLEGDTIELLVDLSMVAILIFGAIGIFKFKSDRVIYCIGINLLSFAILYNTAIGAGGGLVNLFWLNLVPLLIFFFLDRTEAIISTILFLCLSSMLLVYPQLFGTFDYGWDMGYRFCISLFFITMIAYSLESSRYRFSSLLQRSNNELISEKKRMEIALAEIKTLSGLLPICASCKKIRDDKGYWNQIEGYIQKHSDAQFSHGMCPECSDELYGKEDWYIKMKNEEKQKK